MGGPEVRDVSQPGFLEICFVGMTSGWLAALAKPAKRFRNAARALLHPCKARRLTHAVIGLPAVSEKRDGRLKIGVCVRQRM